MSQPSFAGLNLLPLPPTAPISAVLSPHTHVLSVLHIKTVEAGYNSGRTYYLRFESNACVETIANLSAVARSARIRAEKRTKFERNQLQVKHEAVVKFAIPVKCGVGVEVCCSIEIPPPSSCHLFIRNRGGSGRLG